MLLLVSGEGPTDMGHCVVGDLCEHPEFEPGPMALLADQVVEHELDYTSLPYLMRFLSKKALAARSKRLKPPKLVGRKHRKETTFFFNNARALAQVAQELATEAGDEVVAILFAMRIVPTALIGAIGKTRSSRC